MSATDVSEKHFVRKIKNSAPQPRLHPMLTNRQVEIARLISEGLSEKQIAEHLHVSTYTIKTHRANIMLRIDVHNTAQLVCWLFRQKLLLVEELPDRVSPANENGAGRTGS